MNGIRSERASPQGLRLVLDAAVARNPASVQLLGLCPLLAVSTTVANAVGLAAASSGVLIGATLCVASVRRWIPGDVRLPCFVLVIATFTTVAMLIMQAYAFETYERIALFVQIIVTNCLILGRVEQVASRQPVVTALCDAVGAAIGFAAVLVALGAVREALTWAGIPLAGLAPGAFIIAGLMLAIARRSGVEHEPGEAATDLRATERG